MMDERRAMLQRWVTAPQWLISLFAISMLRGSSAIGDEFILLDANGNELERLGIGHLDIVCKPEGQGTDRCG